MSRSPRMTSVFALLAIVAGSTSLGAAEFVVNAVTVPDLKAVFGQVASRTVVPARARLGGSVRDIRVSEGQEVKTGEIVAVVVDEKLALERSSADAKIKALVSQLDNARTELERTQQLLERGVTSQARLDQAKLQFDVIVNQVAAARADMAVIDQRAREGEVLAPADGRVLRVPVTPGSVVLPGEEVARIASGKYYLRLSLPERHAREIKENATVRIGRRGLSPAAAGSLADARIGRVAKVYPEIADGRVTADVEVDDIGDYFVNERTMVWIPVATRSVLAVPANAIVTRHGVDYVRVRIGDGAADVAVIPGGTLHLDGAPRIEILSGLRDGDRILLQDGKP
jgi:RND family efflux transporter MFP subunit